MVLYYSLRLYGRSGRIRENGPHLGVHWQWKQVGKIAYLVACPQFTNFIERVRLIEACQVDMEMENRSAMERRMVGRDDRVSRLGDEWEPNLCYLIGEVLHFTRTRQTLQTFGNLSLRYHVLVYCFGFL